MSCANKIKYCTLIFLSVLLNLNANFFFSFEHCCPNSVDHRRSMCVVRARNCIYNMFIEIFASLDSIFSRYLCKLKHFLHKWVKANFNNHYMDFVAGGEGKKGARWVQKPNECISIVHWKCSSPRMCVNMDASSCFILLNSCYFCHFHYSQAFFFLSFTFFLRTDSVFFRVVVLPLKVLLCLCMVSICLA